jgi:thiol:disulfide interchange protein
MRTDGARPQRRFPWVLAAAAAVALGARLMGPSVQDRVPWVPIASADALERGDRPIFYNFTAEWCAPCKRLEREVFADPRQARMLSRKYVPVRVLDRQREDGGNPPEVEGLQERFAVSAFPTLIAARRDGTVLARLEGYQGGRGLNDFFNTAWAVAQKKR